MKLPLSRILRELTGRAARDYAQLLTAQVTAAVAAAEALRDHLTDGPKSIAAVIDEYEDAGDAARGELVQELARALATPLDREDLFRVSRSVDDVLDNLRDFAHEMELYQPDEPKFSVGMLSAIIVALQTLEQAVGALDGSLADVRKLADRAKHQSNDVRRQYELAVAALFQQDLTMATLRDRELLRRLDVVGLRIGEAVEALTDGTLKRGA